MKEFIPMLGACLVAALLVNVALFGLQIVRGEVICRAVHHTQERAMP